MSEQKHGIEQTPTILVVDDDDELRQIIREIAEKNGVAVIEGRNGHEGLELAKKNRPDGIISDISMPVMDGIRFLTETRGAGLTIPFVILTGYGDKESAIAALRYGAYAFLEKPFEEADLAKVIREAVDYGRQLKALDTELNEACAQAVVSPDRIDEFRKAKRAVLLLKKRRGHG